MKAAHKALEHIDDLTGHETVGATGAQPREDDGWTVQVEVIEEHRIPSSADLLALFTVDMDESGEVLSYRRTRRYARGKGDEFGEA